MKFEAMIRFIVLVAVVMVSLLSCDEAIDANIFRYGEEKDFKMNIVYTSEDKKLKIEIREINDSRCPTGVVCVWQGMAQIKIATISDKSGEVNINTYNNQKDTLDSWTFRLLDVKPYPVYKEPVTDEQKLTTMVIDKIKN